MSPQCAPSAAKAATTLLLVFTSNFSYKVLFCCGTYAAMLITTDGCTLTEGVQWNYTERPHLNPYRVVIGMACTSTMAANSSRAPLRGAPGLTCSLLHSLSA